MAEYNRELERVELSSARELINLTHEFPTYEFEFEAHKGGVKTTYTVYEFNGSLVITPLEDFTEHYYTEQEFLDDFEGYLLTVSDSTIRSFVVGDALFTA